MVEMREVLARGGNPVTSSVTEADRWARSGSLLRRVYDCLADGEWHTGQQLCAAYRGEFGGGWEWQSCVSQLRKKLRPQGGDILEEDIKGEYQGRYRLILPRQAALAEPLARTDRYLELLEERERKREDAKKKEPARLPI